MMLREPWRTRLLFLSFAINLVMIPIAGARYVMPRPAMHGPPRTEAMVERMAHDLPQDDANRFRATMDTHLPDIEAARARMEAARRVMNRTMRHRPFDPASMRVAMVNWKSAWNGWSDNLGEAMLAALAGLSDEGRDRLADGGERRPPP